MVRVALERMGSGQAFAQQNAQRPPVDRFGVGPSKQHLRLPISNSYKGKKYSHVLLSSAVAVGAQLVDRSFQIFFEVVVAGKAEIGKFDVSVSPKKHIFGLQISLFVKTKSKQT